MGVIQAGLSGGDETSAFGVRNESGTALFRIDTQASLACAQQVLAAPVLNGASTSNAVAVAIDAGVRLFDGSCSEEPFSFNFGL